MREIEAEDLSKKNMLLEEKRRKDSESRKVATKK